jgi:hypothetical protein
LIVASLQRRDADRAAPAARACTRIPDPPDRCGTSRAEDVIQLHLDVVERREAPAPVFA